MVDLASFRADVSDEVSTILAPSFELAITSTNFVPHSDDVAITFPNLDARYQNVKLIETTVLYVDMRRSTELSLKHHSHTVARLYSAFVRAMTRCAKAFGGEVRGIIGDRVMILFDSLNCYANAIDTAILVNSVCKYVLNGHFTEDEVSFGIGIDFGKMLATKTGVRRHGSAQQSYRSLVWLGRPANVASKLTDHANKPKKTANVTKVRVAYNRPGRIGLTYQDEWPHDFVLGFTHSPLRGLMVPRDPAFHSYSIVSQEVVITHATPRILVSKRVFDGYKLARPQSKVVLANWFTQLQQPILDVPDAVYGGNVIYTVFKE
jgi:adenylate cyclase